MYWLWGTILQNGLKRILCLIWKLGLWLNYLCRCQFGVPDVLHTDQGRNFESALLKEVCQLLGVVKTRTTPYHPQSDGLVERFNRTLLNLLSMAASDNERDWGLHIPMVMMAYRTSVQESTGCTPFYLMFGREGRLPADVMFCLPSFPMQVNKVRSGHAVSHGAGLSACSQPSAVTTATSEGSI